MATYKELVFYWLITSIKYPKRLILFSSMDIDIKSKNQSQKLKKIENNLTFCCFSVTKKWSNFVSLKNITHYERIFSNRF